MGGGRGGGPREEVSIRRRSLVLELWGNWYSCGLDVIQAIGVLCCGGGAVVK